MPLDPNYRKTRKTHSRDTRAAQPAATDVLEGTLYFITDEGVIEQSNGVSWVNYSSSTVPPGAFTQGSVVFAGPSGVLGQDNANLFWDDTNNRLGVGTTTTPSLLTVNGLLNLKNYTVTTLPAGTRGDVAYVTDALAPTFLAVLVGGGTVVTPCFFNGTNWVGF